MAEQHRSAADSPGRRHGARGDPTRVGEDGARSDPTRGARDRARGEPVLFEAGLIVLAAYNLGLAIFMVISPHSFFRALGPFEDLNRHYIRDFATYSAAMGVAAAVALRRPSWRVPVLAISTIQFGLHTVNHLVDASSAHPRWTGWFDFVSLLASAVLLAWMWRSAARHERRAARDARVAPPAAGNPLARTSVSSSPRAERSTT